MAKNHPTTPSEASTAGDVVPPVMIGDGRTFLGHPRGLFLLFLVEMWERFSYYGMRALLVLYLIRSVSPEPEKGLFGQITNAGRGWSEGQANTLYGWYTGLAYLLPIVGGLIADKILGTHRSMLLGGIVIALGHVILAVSGLGALAHNDAGMSLFIMGLATIVIGTGYFKPTVSVMVGQLYPPGDPRRDGGFSIFYMGINLGAFICAFICGTLGEKVGWHWGFGSAAVGMIAGLVLYIWGKPHYLKGIGDAPAGKKNLVLPLLVGSVVVAGLIGYAYYGGAFNALGGLMSSILSNGVARIAVPAVLGAVVLGLVSWFIAIQRPGDKGPVSAIFIFMFFNAFFWIAFEQAGSTLNVFAENSTHRMIGSFEVPATWFQSVNAGLIILLAPVFGWLWGALGRRNPSQPVKISLGLILLGLGYVVMVLAAKQNFSTGARVGMSFLLMTYLLHTLGELCLSPTGLSFVTKTAPVRFVSLLMGVWFISSFMANLGGGLIAAQVEKVERGEIKLPWQSWGLELGGRSDYFMLFVVSSLGAGLLILIASPWLKKLYHGRGEASGGGAH